MKENTWMGAYVAIIAYLVFIAMPSFSFFEQLFGNPNSSSFAYNFCLFVTILFNLGGMYLTLYIYVKIYSYFEK